MKDLIITSSRLKKEIYVVSACFITAFVTNIVAIIIFKTPWYETFTQIGYVIVITAVLYLIVTFFRLIALGITRLIKKS
jgi:uncharacterized membrane protein YhaH (DUF805 family)